MLLLKSSCVVDKWYNEEKDWKERKNEITNHVNRRWRIGHLGFSRRRKKLWVQRNFHQLRNIVYNCYLCVSLPIKHRNRNSWGWLCSGGYAFHSPLRSRQNSPLIQFATPQYFAVCTADQIFASCGIQEVTMISPPNIFGQHTNIYRVRSHYKSRLLVLVQ